VTDRKPGWLRYAIDFSSPLALLVTYFGGGKDFILATGVSIAVAVVALAVGLAVERRLAVVPLIMVAVGILFGGLTVLFKADWILKVRPTIMNYVFAAIFFGGVLLKKNPIKAVLGWAIDVPVETWRTIEIRYAWWSVFLGTANLAVWQLLSEATWVTWDTIGIRVLSAAFGIAQMPLLMKHMKVEDIPPPPMPPPTE
jgi:intracellular septation protein